MNSIIITLFFLFPFNFSSNFGTGCKMEYKGSTTEIIDSTQFMISFYDKLDISNQKCLYFLHEDCQNIVPIENVKKLMIIYVHAEEKSSDYSFASLFNKRIDEKILKNIKAIYVYEVDTGKDVLYTEESDIKSILN